MSLRRTLGVTDLTLLVIGNVIGSGIFIVPSSVLRESGSVTAAALVWLLGGLLSLLGALSYGELASMEGGSGGLYGFIRDAFGRFPAFLYGWTLFFVIGAGTIATLAVAAAGYMGQFTTLSPVAQKAIAVGLIGLMCAINVRGMRESASVQNAATGIKVGAILVMSVILFALGDGGGEAAAVSGASAVSSGVSLSGVGLATISVLWAYEGWQYVTFTDAEAVDPQRSLPRAIALGTAALVAIYLVANFAYLAALGPARVAASERVAGDAVAAVLGPAAGRLIAVAIIVSMYSAAHATVITAPRVYYAMARDGVFFSALAREHPTFGTPALAIITSCVWAMVLAVTGTFEQLLTYVVFVGWVFYAVGAAAVIALRRSRPHAARPFRVPGYPVTPVLFVLAAAAIVGNTIVSQPGRAAVGVGMVLLGAPAYAMWRRRASPR
ncbi:MAG: amino acid permease [Gemmatimonadaceae bacterium]|nr:amino acid permease [Gemmatimonadaceae bacterium]